MATGSLLGRADASLVKAATDAAMANVPKSMAPIHKRIMAARGAGMQALGAGISKAIQEAGEFGGKLIERNQKQKLGNASANSYGNKEEFESDTPTTEQPAFLTPAHDDDKKIQGWNEQLATLHGQTQFEDKTSNPEAFEEIEKLEKKVQKRTDRLQKRTPNIYVGIDGEDNEVEIRTVEEQLKIVRKEKASLGMFGDKDKINPVTKVAYTKQERKDRRAELDEIKNNMKQSAIDFQTFGAILDEKLKRDDNGNITGYDLTATHLRDPASLPFAYALHAGTDNKALGSEWGDLEGARVISGFDKKGIMTLMFVNKYGKQIIGANKEPMTIQKGNVGSVLVSKNPTVESNMNIATDRKANYADGKKGLDFAAGNIKTAVNGIQTVDDWYAAASFTGGADSSMDGSLTESLYGLTTDPVSGERSPKSTQLSERLFGEIMKITDPDIVESFNVSGPGGVKDEILTKEDFDLGDTPVDDETSKAVVANYDILIKYILSGKNLLLSKQILSHHMHIEAMNSYSIGAAENVEEEEEKWSADDIE